MLVASFKLKIHSRTVWCLHLYQLAQWLFPFSEHERFVPLSDRGDLILWLCVNWTDSNTASYHHSTTFAFPFINERLHQLFTVENELEIKELQWKKKKPWRCDLCEWRGSLYFSLNLLSFAISGAEWKFLNLQN